MRLFVGVWPTDDLVTALSARHWGPAPGLRWVPPENWHATLAFLGSVPDDEHPELIATLESIGPKVAASWASVGPATSVLGQRILHVPVTGLEELANTVLEATMAFNRSPDRDQSFLGHLTLARARRGQRIPSALIGVPLMLDWPIREFRLVSSITGREGARYTPVASMGLEGFPG